ncbi:hypothetical protein CONPUDRAFT_163060 [Coniophora puteana RWD-64-598 SS2]|uniref:Uncharacterized protein n=1 Tax=Coniophora puteana (strain RWD-64-598) TaxID=741705 RepID=A0A5M3MXE6_CONPW|nr:uncharacterized protein CONPUDRAFT_163060 [Coniophora puteana RWD-64-598 SS2]EIW83756.1 hypothetical protein CONPUDRAFT_163060 [Coniophora puteana RWD-64-598 SS2]
MQQRTAHHVAPIHHLDPNSYSMTSPELSITLSVAQLLQFEVCASLSEEQPRLQLGTLQQSSLPAGSQDLSSVDIKFETQLVDGRRILRVFAIPKAGLSRTNNTSSLDAYTFQHRASHFEDLTRSSSTSSCSNASSTISSPAAFDCYFPDDLMKDINYESFLSSFSSSNMYLDPLGSVDQLPPLKGNFPSQCNEEPLLLQCIDTLPSFTPQNPETSEACSGTSSTTCQLPSPAPTEPAVSAGTDTSASNTPAVHHEEEPAGRRRRARRFSCLELTCSRKFASKDYTCQRISRVETYVILTSSTAGCSGHFSVITPRVSYPSNGGVSALRSYGDRESFQEPVMRLRKRKYKLSLQCKLRWIYFLPPNSEAIAIGEVRTIFVESSLNL